MLCGANKDVFCLPWCTHVIGFKVSEEDRTARTKLLCVVDGLLSYLAAGRQTGQGNWEGRGEGDENEGAEGYGSSDRGSGADVGRGGTSEEQYASARATWRETIRANNRQEALLGGNAERRWYSTLLFVGITKPRKPPSGHRQCVFRLLDPAGEIREYYFVSINLFLLRTLILFPTCKTLHCLRKLWVLREFLPGLVVFFTTRSNIPFYLGCSILGLLQLLNEDLTNI